MLISILLVLAFYSIVQVQLDVGTDCGGCSDTNANTKPVNNEPNFLSDIINQTINEGGNQVGVAPMYIGNALEPTTEVETQPSLFVPPPASASLGEILPQNNSIANKTEDSECNEHLCGLGSIEPSEPKTSGASVLSDSKTTKLEVGTQPEIQPHSCPLSSNSIVDANQVVVETHACLQNGEPIKSKVAEKKPLFTEGANPQVPLVVGQVQLNNTILNQTDNGTVSNQTENSTTGSKDRKKPNLFTGKIKPSVNKSEGAANLDWTYKSGPNGPSHWAERNGSQCGGKKQSPINLELGTFNTLNNMSKLTWSKHYRTFPSGMTSVNNEHTIKLTVNFDGEDAPSLEGGPLKTPYSLEEIHFHWGKSDLHGSEHTINKRSFPMEMHVIHIGSHLCNKSTALKTDQGVVVVGYLFEIDKEPNEALGNILTVVDNLKVHDSPTKLNSVFKLGDLLDLFETDYVTYNGSFTRPPCYESVIWLVSPYTLSISHKQLEKFRQVLSDNYRPLQPLNGRTVNFVHG